MAVRLKDQLYRIKSLWHQYNEAKGSQIAGGLFRALDKAIDPEQYKDTKPSEFRVGDKISISWTVCKSILHGKRRMQRETRTATGTVVEPMPGDEKCKDERIRITFDEKEEMYCPLCQQKAGARFGFRCHPDDLRVLGKSHT